MESIFNLLLLGIVMACVLGMVQYKYALSGYPRNLKWHIVLALSGFLTGVLAGRIIVSDFEDVSPFAVMLISGSIFGYASLKWMPQRSKTFMPAPRDD